MINTSVWRDAGRDLKVASIEGAYNKSPILRITTEVVIHETTEVAAAALESAKQPGSRIRVAPRSARPCPCCGSRYATITERRPDLEIYINRRTGRRVNAAKLTPAQRAHLESVAEHVPILLRVSRPQLPLLFAPTDSKLLVTGAGRAGKSQVCAYWLVRQWLMTGGKQAQFWIVAPTRTLAFELLTKIIHGDEAAPPILPATLFTFIPPTEHGKRALLCDGSILALKHLASRGGTNLKSSAVRAILIDEAATMKTRDQLATLEQRVHTTMGGLLLATTPTKDHWLKQEVRDPCLEWQRMPDEQRAAVDIHVGMRWSLASLSMPDNPWNDPVHTYREIQGKGGEADPAVLRDYFGVWAGSSGSLWREFNLDAHTFDNEYRDLQEWDSQRRCDITPTVSRRIFGGVNPLYKGLRASDKGRFIACADVNISPHTTLILQVSCDPAAPDKRDRWKVWVWDMIQTWKGDASNHARALAGKQLAKTMRPDSAGDTYHGIGIIVDGTAIGRDPTAHRYGGDPKGLVQVFGALGFDVRPPLYTDKRKPANPNKPDSYALLHRLLREQRIHIHERRCRPLIDALIEQEDSGDGNTPVKVSHNRSDRVSSSVDALRYGLWAIFYGARVGGPSTLVDAGGMFGNDAAFGSGSAFEDEAA